LNTPARTPTPYETARRASAQLREDVRHETGRQRAAATRTQRLADDATARAAKLLDAAGLGDLTPSPVTRVVPITRPPLRSRPTERWGTASGGVDDSGNGGAA